MARLDWSEAEKPQGFEPGIYLCEVAEAVEKTSQKGDPYFKVMLVAVSFGKRKLCDDTLMLAGKGAGIGYSKLRALGVEQGRTSMQAGELIGRRVYARVDAEEWTNEKGKSGMQLKVNIKAPGSEMGYWPESSKPEGVIEPAADDWRKSETKPMPADVDDTPF